MAKTLCALARVSRCWSSSAIRALWNDPSRALASQEQAPDVPNLFLKRPHRTITVSVSWDLPYKTEAEHYKPLNRIRHLILEPDEDEDEEAYGDLVMGLDVNALQAVRELTFCQFDCLSLLDSFDSLLFNLPVTHLNLEVFHCCEDHLATLLSPPRFPCLSHLSLRVHDCPISSLEYLPEGIQSFTFRFLHPESSLWVYGYEPPPPSLPALSPRPSLTSLTFERLHLSLADLARLVTAFPALRHVDLSEVTWNELEWLPPTYTRAFEALSAFVEDLPHLFFLSLGYLPLFASPRGEALRTFFHLADDRGLDLRYNFPLSSDAGDDKTEDSDRLSEWDGGCDEWEHDWKWIESCCEGPEQFFLEPVAADPPTPPSSPSSPFRLADRQVYVDEPLCEPRWGLDLEAEDEEVEEEKEEPDEPWRRWETEEDVVEADRRWEAFEPMSD
ncbi:hypothetical protein JCM6882_009596 [Rhodosporidiobolus microsporus]